MYNFKKNLGDKKIAVVLIKGEGKGLSYTLNNIQDSDLNQCCFLSTDHCFSDTKYDRKEFSFDIVSLPHHGIDYLIDNTTRDNKSAIKKISEIIRGKEKKYVVINHIENLAPVPFGEKEQQGMNKIFYQEMLSVLRNIVVSELKNDTQILLLTQSSDFYHTVENYVRDNVFMTMFDIFFSIAAKNSEDSVDYSLFFPTEDSLVSDTPVKTGVVRIDTIINLNKISWGETLFYSSSEAPVLVSFALTAVISASPVCTQVLYLSPFRSAAKIGSDLKKINDHYKKITKRSMDKTKIVSAEAFRGLNLNDKKVLMDTIYKHINDFRNRLDILDMDHGICLIDIVDIDQYGAGIDYPSLRWYASINNILIIIGTDVAEERYTFRREMIATSSNTAAEYKQINADTHNLALPQQKKNN